MGSEDFTLEGYNMFLNPRLFGAQQQFFGGGFNYEDIISIHGAPTYNAAMGDSFLSASGISDFSSQNMFGVPYTENQNQLSYDSMLNRRFSYYNGNNMYGNSFIGGQNRSQQSYNIMFDGGVAYRSSSSLFSGQNLLGFSGINVSTSEEVYIGGAYIPTDISKTSKEYSYSISTNGTVRYIGPNRKILSLEEFKAGVGDDFDKFKEVINKDCKERGFNEAIS